MRWARVQWKTLGMLGAASLAAVARADEPEPLRIEASVAGGMSMTPPTTVVVEPDGVARIVQKGRTPATRDVTVDLSLDRTELDEIRRLVLESRFFETWGPSGMSTDQATWDVTVRLGDRLLRRPHMYMQPEFEALERHLARFVLQATLTGELRRGEYWSTRTALRYEYAQRPIRPAALLPEIVDCASGIRLPTRCAEAAEILLSFPPDEAWLGAMKDLLRRIDGDRRGEVLATWAEGLRRPEHAALHDAFQATALAEVVASWPRWPSMSTAERGGVGAVLTMLLRDRMPEAFGIAESMARSFGTLEKSFLPPGLLETGAAATPVVLRLLEGPAPAARMSGADMARALTQVLRKRWGVSEQLSDAERSALEGRLRDEIVPALERGAHDEPQPFSVRKACLDALDAWDGRVKAALAKVEADAKEARRRADAERERSAPPPMLEGSLSISGRLLGPSDAPLAGVRVFATRQDGRALRSAVTREDGSFVVERLAAGVHDLMAIAKERTAGPDLRGARPDVTGVATGTSDVVLRLPGSLIRGRLLDTTGAPVAGRRVLARMRNPPTAQGPAYGSASAETDAQGRFWLLRLLPGTYDLDAEAGGAPLRGSTGIETGLEERTVQILEIPEGGSIAGRIVDEADAPIEGAWVSAGHDAAEGQEWRALQTSQTARDGSFRFDHLDPGLRYRVWASIGAGEQQRNANVADVSTGTQTVTLKIDTAPRLRIRIAFHGRDRPQATGIRIERVAGGSAMVREFQDPTLDWRAALAGTWKVSAKTRDVDARGVSVDRWVEVGTVTTGDPEKVFDVER